MDVSELKARVKIREATVVTSPSACGWYPPKVQGPTLPDDGSAEKDVIDAQITEISEEDDEVQDDLFYAMNLLSEAQDALSSILKLDKRVNVLSINHWKDINTLIDNIEEFSQQFLSSE